MYTDWKERNKIAFADNRIVYIENPKESVKILQNMYSSITVDKTNIHKSITFLYINTINEDAEIEVENSSIYNNYKENRKKTDLNLNIQKTKIMASGPITSWQIDGGKVETETDFIFLDSKITTDGDCSHEIKKRLLLGRKTMTNLDSALKSRGTTLLIKVCIVKTMIFSSSHVWM